MDQRTPLKEWTFPREIETPVCVWQLRPIVYSIVVLFGAVSVLLALLLAGAYIFTYSDDLLVAWCVAGTFVYLVWAICMGLMPVGVKTVEDYDSNLMSVQD